MAKTKADEYYEMARRLDEAQSNLARLARQSETHRLMYMRHYNALRRLENAVRETIVVGERVNPDGLLALLRRVPKHPRPTLTQIRKGRRRRA